jgi:hypothetical protein
VATFTFCWLDVKLTVIPVCAAVVVNIPNSLYGDGVWLTDELKNKF